MMQKTINPLRTIFALLFFLAMTAGCGQKGPLFLPGDPSSIQTDIPGQNQPEESDDNSDDEEKDE